MVDAEKEKKRGLDDKIQFFFYRKKRAPPRSFLRGTTTEEREASI